MDKRAIKNKKTLPLILRKFIGAFMLLNLIFNVSLASVANAYNTNAERRTADFERGKSSVDKVSSKTSQPENAQASVLQDGETKIKGTQIKPTQVTVVDMRQVAEKQSQTVPDFTERFTVPSNPSVREEDLNLPRSRELPTDGSQSSVREENIQTAPSVASPAPSTSYIGHPDGPKLNTTSFTIPPDTMGAVGIDKVVTSLNNNFVIQNKLTGVPLLTASQEVFWAASTGTGVFDPRVLYDKYNNRWILAITSNAGTAGSSVLVAVSQTADPLGLYYMFRFQVDDCGASCGTQDDEWADFPMLGFNKNYVAISVNMFTNANDSFTQGRVLVLDYPQLRNGTATNSVYFANNTIGFCNHPATTFSATEETLYFAQHISSGSANYSVSTLSGAFPAPSLSVGAAKVRPGGGWTQPGGNIAPQKCDPILPANTGCPATLRKLAVGDAFVRSNVVFRNNRIWYAQTVGLPAGGTAARTAIQWTSLQTNGDFADGGRIDDATATATNGGSWYAYPSISVNANNDVLVGFSEFESDDFVDAAYAFRYGTDAAGTMRDPYIYKEGEDYYDKTFGGTANRWGDYSHTVVDPVNDLDLWTLQEYAAQRITPGGLGSNDSRWSTWWAKIALAPPTASAAAVSGKITDGRGRALSRVRLTLLDTTTGEQTVAFTQRDGVYTFESVEVGKTYLLTPSLRGYKFTPEYKNIVLLEDLTDSDFRGVLTRR